MKNNYKKVLLSLAAAITLSTSVGQAASVNYKNNQNQYSQKRYVITYNNYLNNYLTSRFGNIIIRIRPSVPTKPETPVEENENPNSNIGKEKENNNNNKNNNNNNNNSNNNTPETKPNKPAPGTNVGTNESIEQEVVRLVNIERQKAGLAPLQYSEELSRVARIKSQDMADNNYFSHTSPTYGDPFAMMRSFGIQYRTAGENIAKGYTSAQSVVNGWMNSSGHRANILNPNFGKIGVGYVKANGTTYWTQMFTD